MTTLERLEDLQTTLNLIIISVKKNNYYVDSLLLLHNTAKLADSEEILLENRFANRFITFSSYSETLEEQCKILGYDTSSYEDLGNKYLEIKIDYFKQN